MTSEGNTILGLVAHEGLHHESARAGRNLRLEEKPENCVTTLVILGSTHSSEQRWMEGVGVG